MQAKRVSFAGEGNKFVSPETGCKSYFYQDNHWKYQDNYFGSLVDIGMEVVWYKDSPIWGMNHYGGVVNDGRIHTTIIFVFLKNALLKTPPDFPVRGPKYYRENQLIYRNSYFGNLSEYKGEEKIYLNRHLVYQKTYHGGLIKVNPASTNIAL